MFTQVLERNILIMRKHIPFYISKKQRGIQYPLKYIQLQILEPRPPILRLLEILKKNWNVQQLAEKT
jgi:hypothetical protein